MNPVLAVLARCRNGHEEANTAEAFYGRGLTPGEVPWGGSGRICARCHGPLTVIREAVVGNISAKRTAEQPEGKTTKEVPDAFRSNDGRNVRHIST